MLWRGIGSDASQPVGAIGGFQIRGLQLMGLRQRPVCDADSFGRIGNLEVKLASTYKEIKKAQKLRFDVFFRDGGAKAGPETFFKKRDIDPFDAVCDHLLVVDHDVVDRFGRNRPKVVGCYRLLPQDRAAGIGGFYTSREFAIEPLLARHPSKRFLELGRSCVHPNWRSKRVLELLWRGIWTYVQRHQVDVLIGCASLPGAEPADNWQALAYLSRIAQRDGEWAAEVRKDRPASGFSWDVNGAGPDVIRRLPPLVRSYLRIGARFGDGFFVDRQFGVIDVLVIMPVAEIQPRYRQRFGGEAGPLAEAA
jgi:putative hemolysin